MAGATRTAAAGAGSYDRQEESPQGDEKTMRKSSGVYLLILLAFLSVQFGHGCNIGVAVSMPGESKAMNLALGSWVMVGVCLGLPLTPWACRTFGVFRVCAVCVVIDFLAILLMLYPGITLQQIYVVRFLCGFFEAPFLPYLQEWLARFGKHTWNVWNTVLHAMVPLGENLGYIVAQELVAAKYSWQWAFAGQAAVLALSAAAVYAYGGRKYLDLSYGKAATSYYDTGAHDGGWSVTNMVGDHDDDCNSLADSLHDDVPPDLEVEYPVTERWIVYWATNVALAAQLGFLSGSKYVIRDWAMGRGFSLHFVIFTFSAIALIGPALGGSIAMSGSLVRPDQWSQHKRTLMFLTCTSSVAAGCAVMLPYIPDSMSGLFWPALFVSFTAAGGVYPAAQGIINIALTASRVIEASVYQVQCNNILFAMPMPYVIGRTMDAFGYEASFKCVTILQVLAAAGFFFAFVAASCTEERSAWHRMRDAPRAASNNDLNGMEMEMARGGERSDDSPREADRMRAAE